jgi:hypothetical protein
LGQRRKQRHGWHSNCTIIARQDAADSVLIWMFRPTSTTELEDPEDSILLAITAALATTTQLLGKPHNILVMGRACFLRVPVSEANDLNYLLWNA